MFQGDRVDRMPAGRTLGGYEIERSLGEGGMGAVYRAHDPRLDRPVALKILHPHLGRDREFAQRFIREAQMAAKLEHPGIVQTYAAGEDANRCYIAMQFVEGVELHDLMRGERKLPVHVALRIVRDVADALAAAHDREIIHRDIKPANVMITPDGRVKVMDFGLARSIRVGNRLTETGTYLGTPEYSAPEQCVSEDIDQRADLYSVGVILYEMLAGIVPHTGDTPYSLFKRIVEEPPLPLGDVNPDVPAPVREIVHRLLEKAPRDRYAGGRDVVAAIDAALASFRGGAERAREDLVEIVRRTREVAGAGCDPETLRLNETGALAEPSPTACEPAAPARRTPTFVPRRRPGRTAMAVAVVLSAAILAIGLAWPGPDVSPVPSPDPIAGPAPDGEPEPARREPVPLLGADGRITVAVFDFQNLQGRSDLEWLRVGLTEMLITNLASCRELTVLTRDRVHEVLAASAGPESGAAEVARKLGAGLVVRGQFLTDEDGRVRVTVQIIRGDQHLAPQTVEGTLERVFRLVDRLSAQVVEMIEAYRREQVAPPATAGDPTAYALPETEPHRHEFDYAQEYRERQANSWRRKEAFVQRAAEDGFKLQAQGPEEHRRRVLEDLQKKQKKLEEHVDGGDANADPKPEQAERSLRASAPIDWHRVIASLRRLTERYAQAPGAQVAQSEEALEAARELEQCLRFFESNRWTMEDPDRLALQSYGQGRALLEKEDATPQELVLAHQLLRVAEELGHPDERLGELQAECARRLEEKPTGK